MAGSSTTGGSWADALMTRRGWIALGGAALVPLLIAWIWVVAPGYTDAEYYMATAQRLASGHGLSEPFVWNYLAGVRTIPHASHLYWMPLTTFVAAIPMAIAGPSFRIAQLPFILVALSLPLLSAWMTLRLGGGRRQALFAGILASLPGFYLPFLLTTDAFGLYSLLGTAILLSLAHAVEHGQLRWSLAAGAAIGLAHLTRADGLVFALPALWSLRGIKGKRGRHAVAMIAGYSLVAVPWMIRMVQATGSLLPPGAGRTLWLPDYDSLFSYPSSALTPAALLAKGAGVLVKDRLNALLTNLGALFLVNGLVFLGPFMLWGGWRLRRKPLVQMAALFMLGLLAVMSFVFPFPGVRGGFFHSSSALMPTLWALASFGLYDAVQRLAAWRGWERARAVRMFTAGAVAISLVATAFLFWVRLVVPAANGQGWGRTLQSYRELDGRLVELGKGVGPVAVNDPPGYWLASGQQAVVVPNGGPASLLSVVGDFGVGWVLLDANRPAGLADLFANPQSIDGLSYVETVSLPKLGQVRLYRTDGAP
jgi:hypothetical protein